MKPGLSKLTRFIFPSRVELLTVLVALFIGIIMVISIPPGAGYDEETHMIRVWEISHYYLIPNEQVGQEVLLPKIFWEMSYRRNLIVRPLTDEFWLKYADKPIDVFDYYYIAETPKTRSFYSPILFVPQALAMRFFGLKLRFSALDTYYWVRFAGLLAYVFLIWMAVRIAPFGKWLFFVVALAPTALYQAATINADTVSNGIVLVFISICLAISRSEFLSWRAMIGLLVSLSFLFITKTNQAVLAILPFLLISPRKFSKRQYIFLIVSSIVLFLVFVVGWYILAYSQPTTTLKGADSVAQINFLFFHPVSGLKVLWTNIIDNGINYGKEAIATFGYGYWSFPKWVYPLYILALLCALFFAEETSLNKSDRLVFITTFTATYLTTVLSLYIAINPVGSSIIDGIQGRYFIPFMPLLLLSLYALPVLKPVNIISWVFSPSFLVGSLVLFTAGLILSYHVVCGSSFFSVGLCYQPNYKNWSPNALFTNALSKDITVKQEFLSECEGLSEVRVWVTSQYANPNGKTAIELFDVKGQLLAQKKFSNQDLPDGGWMILEFDPFWDSKGKNYQFVLTANQTPAINVATSILREYEDGALYIGNEILDQDSVFKYGCVDGWEKFFYNLRNLFQPHQISN